MNTNRLWIVASVLAIAALLAGTYLLGVAPQLANAASAAQERNAVIQTNANEQATLDALEKADKNKSSLESQLEKLREVVPSDAGLDPVIKQIGDMGTESEILVESIKFDAPIPFIPAPDMDPEAAAAASSVSGGNLLVIPVTITASDSDYNQLMDFLDKIQHSKRLILVYQYTLFAEEDGSEGGLKVNMTIVGQMFVLLDSSIAATDPGSDSGTEDGSVTQ